MTCIVALKADNGVYLIGDRAACSENTAIPIKHAKIFRSGPALIGFAGSFSVHQALLTKFSWPKDIDRSNLYLELCSKILPALKDIVESDDLECDDTDLIIGVYGEIIVVEAVSQIVIPDTDCESIGVFQHASSIMGVAEGTSRERLVKTMTSIAKLYPSHVLPPFDIAFTESDHESSIEEK
jgi:ATP-dependent protease HslVU (ClpYQ) peptidase subunit